MADRWYTIDNAQEIPSPALVIYPQRVRENIRRMIDIAGGTERLRPHVKTHKMAEVVRLQQEAGITRFKCSTIAEAEMVARCGAADVLLAYPQLGPNMKRLLQLTAAFDAVRFSTIADDADSITALAATFAGAGRKIDVLVDIDNGQHRSGVAPGPAAVDRYRQLVELEGVQPGGLHVYDGHIHDTDLEQRTRRVEAAFAPVTRLIDTLKAAGWPVPQVVAGGTPTFPIHIRHPGRQCSPGTCLLWDVGYATKFPDLDFLPAALVLCRVVSKPGDDRLCLDVGYKAVASDHPGTRVELFELSDVEVVTHNEEHLAIKTSSASKFAVGDVVYAVPFHVCPTCALYSEAVVVENRRASRRWAVAARDRKLTY